MEQSNALAEKNAVAKRSILIALMVSALLPPFMSSSITVALPSIGKEFGMNAASLSWVSTAFVHKYNFVNLHSALGYQTPAESYYPSMLLQIAWVCKGRWSTMNERQSHIITLLTSQCFFIVYNYHVGDSLNAQTHR